MESLDSLVYLLGDSCHLRTSIKLEFGLEVLYLHCGNPCVILSVDCVKKGFS